MSRRVVVMKLPVTSCPRLQASSHPKLHAESDADLLLCSSGTWGVMGTLHRLTDLCLPPPRREYSEVVPVDTAASPSGQRQVSGPH